MKRLPLGFLREPLLTRLPFGGSGKSNVTAFGGVIFLCGLSGFTSKSYDLTGCGTPFGGDAGLSGLSEEDSLGIWSLSVALLLLLADADRAPVDLILALGGLTFFMPSGDSAFAQLVFRA